MTNESNMEELTYKWLEDCAGQNVADVIGASINVFYSTIKFSDNKDVYQAALLTMKDMVAEFEKIVGNKNLH
jgi:hypothetical protein